MSDETLLQKAAAQFDAEARRLTSELGDKNREIAALKVDLAAMQKERDEAKTELQLMRDDEHSKLTAEQRFQRMSLYMGVLRERDAALADLSQVRSERDEAWAERDEWKSAFEGAEDRVRQAEAQRDETCRDLRDTMAELKQARAENVTLRLRADGERILRESAEETATNERRWNDWERGEKEQMQAERDAALADLGQEMAERVRLTQFNEELQNKIMAYVNADSEAKLTRTLVALREVKAWQAHKSERLGSDIWATVDAILAEQETENDKDRQ